MARKYVAIIYDLETQINMRNWCHDNGFDLSQGYGGVPQNPEDFEFHTTVFYPINEVDEPHEDPGYNLIETREVIPMKFGMLGENQDVPVLKLELCSTIAILRKKYEDMGMQDKWDNYVPHISLSYAKSPRDVSKLQFPNFKLKFNRVTVEDIKE